MEPHNKELSGLRDPEFRAGQLTSKSLSRVSHGDYARSAITVTGWDFVQDHPMPGQSFLPQPKAGMASLQSGHVLQYPAAPCWSSLVATSPPCPS